MAFRRAFHWWVRGILVRDWSEIPLLFTVSDPPQPRCSRFLSEMIRGLGPRTPPVTPLRPRLAEKGVAPQPACGATSFSYPPEECGLRGKSLLNVETKV